MPILPHADQPETQDYYSKITNRKIITAENGASFSLWDQTIPPDGYIAAHYHDFEETLTFLNGRVEVTIDNHNGSNNLRNY